MIIIYGLIGLGIIIFIHELGHFVAARLSGVKVETFSIGMGPVLLRKKIGATEYRLSLFPLGGYCGMKGEKAFQEALENELDSIKKEKDSFYGVHPLKRIFIAFAGPCTNLLFAILAFSIIASIGYTYYTTPNKIILADEIYPHIESVARTAGLMTGDHIVSINDVDTPYFSDISTQITLNAKKPLLLNIKRNENFLTIPIVPTLNKDTGAGSIGIVNWVDPIIESVNPGSGAEMTGLLQGDIITQINGLKISNTHDVQKALETKKTVDITWLRNNKTMTKSLILDNGKAGISFKIKQIHTPQYTIVQSIGRGFVDTFEMLVTTIKSLSLLFKGINLSKAVSGPVRITMMLGEATKAGFEASFSIGIISVCNFLAIISISLFIMNLLPIPVLDGGLILFALIELIRNKPVKPKTLYTVQFLGFFLIMFIFVFALWGDLRFLFTGS